LFDGSWLGLAGVETLTSG